LTGTRSRTVGSSSEPAARPRLGRAFFDRATVRVARDLLGTRVRVADGTGHREVRVVETEAYVRRDAASHAFRGMTRRNRSMFEGPGTLYVFRIHQVVCANLVTRPGEAVLLRAGTPSSVELGSATGPGRLCRVLGITIGDDGEDATGGTRISVLPRERPPRKIGVGPRVGIRRAVDLPLRFWIAGEPSVSRPRGTTASALPNRSRVDGRYRRTRRRSRPSSGGGTSGARIVGR
jgi:DNA-3-methyladenine glycosylase